MQLLDLVKPIEQMSDEELQAKLREVRNNRNHAKPAAQAHVKRAAKKTSNAKVSKAVKITDGLTEKEKLELIAMLQQGELDV